MTSPRSERTWQTVFRNPVKKVLPKRESLASINRRTTCLVLLVLLLASVVLVRMELRVAGGFTILPIQNADVRAQIEGVIEKVQVDEGDLVREGDLIARLSDRDSRVELKTIEARIDEKRARLKMFKVGPRPEEIALARSEVEAAKTRQEHAWRRGKEAGEIHAAQRSKAETAVQKADERLKYARNDLARFRALFQAELVSRKQIEEVEERVAMREREVEEAQAELRTILADDLAQVRKDLADRVSKSAQKGPSEAREPRVDKPADDVSRPARPSSGECRSGPDGAEGRRGLHDPAHPERRRASPDRRGHRESPSG